MLKVTLTSDIIAKLAAIKGQAVIYDESGKAVGLFTAGDPGMREPTISEAELKRCLDSGKWYSTAELLAELAKR